MTTRRRIIIYAGALLASSMLLYMLVFAPRRARDPQRLLTCLPAGGHPLLYVDVEALRRAGVLAAIAGPAGAEEPDYKRFVEATGFDYRTGLDAVAACITPEARLMAVRGRFDEARLAAFAKAHGGRCAGGLCSVEGSSAERQISWVMLESDILGVAVSKDPMAASALAKGSRAAEALPPAPVWLALPGAVLEAREGLPPGLSILMGALSGASRATFAANASEQGFEIRLAAPYDDARRAEAAAKRLSEATEALKTLMAREGATGAETSLEAVLAGGRFRADKTRVEGVWEAPGRLFDAGR